MARKYMKEIELFKAIMKEIEKLIIRKIEYDSSKLISD